jgi:hypothetical protein
VDGTLLGASVKIICDKTRSSRRYVFAPALLRDAVISEMERENKWVACRCKVGWSFQHPTTDAFFVQECLGPIAV